MKERRCYDCGTWMGDYYYDPKCRCRGKLCGTCCDKKDLARAGYGPDADEDDDSAFEPPACAEPVHDPQYRAIQSGDGWLLQRAVRLQADGENGGISWQDVGPVNVEVVTQERYDRLREVARRAIRKLETCGGFPAIAVARAASLRDELAAIDSEVK